MSLIAVSLRHRDLDQFALNFFQRCAAFGNLQLRQAAAIGQLLAGVVPLWPDEISNAVNAECC